MLDPKLTKNKTMLDQKTIEMFRDQGLICRQCGKPTDLVPTKHPDGYMTFMIKPRCKCKPPAKSK